MKPEAVEQAKQRFSKAESALEAFTVAKNYKDAEDAWTDFLIATSAIYSKLEQGAKGNKKSEPWFGRMKNLRRTDPLLSYLHHARDSNEHGIERVVDTTPENQDGYGRSLTFNEKTPTYRFTFSDPATGAVKAAADGHFAGPTLKPIRVHDRRFKDHFDPPVTHLGKDISLPGFVENLAKLAIIYFRSLISEAESLL